MNGRSRVPVVVVQQHRVLREAVQLRLENEPDLDVVASVSAVIDAVDVLRVHPDAVVVLDQPPAVERCHRRARRREPERRYESACTRAAAWLAAQDRDNDLVVLDIGFRQTSQIAELCTAERLYPRAGRDRNLRQIAVVRA